MYRIYSALIEIVAAAVFIIPIWCIYNKLCFHSWKRTIIYMVFGFYFTAVLALVGFPNIASLKIDFAVNIIPFLDMVSDFINAYLNILLFVPFGFFLPILWDKFRNTPSTTRVRLWIPTTSPWRVCISPAICPAASLPTTTPA